MEELIYKTALNVVSYKLRFGPRESRFFSVIFKGIHWKSSDKESISVEELCRASVVAKP